MSSDLEGTCMHICMHKDAYTEIKIILNDGYCTCENGEFLVKMKAKSQNPKINHKPIQVKGEGRN